MTIIVEFSPNERAIVLDLLYQQLVKIADDDGADRSTKKRLRTERRAVARIINKLEGKQPQQQP